MLKEIICAILGHLKGTIHEHIVITFAEKPPSHGIICTCRRCGSVVVLRDNSAKIEFIAMAEDAKSEEGTYVQ